MIPGGMAAALQAADNDAHQKGLHSADDVERASLWLRMRSPRQALLELRIALTRLEEKQQEQVEHVQLSMLEKDQ
jgi:hypothetical protein